MQKNNYDCPRLGLLVGKKKVKKAVKRNKIKRIVRESFRLNKYNLTGLDIVFISQFGIDKIMPKEIKLTLDRQWLKLKN